MNVYENLLESVRMVVKNPWLPVSFLVLDLLSSVTLVMLTMLIFGSRITSLTTAGVGVGEALRTALRENVVGSLIVFLGALIAISLVKSFKLALGIRAAKKKKFELKPEFKRMRETWVRIFFITIFNDLLVLAAAVLSIIANFSSIIVLASILFSFMIRLFTQYNTYFVFVSNKKVVEAITSGMLLVFKRPFESIVIAVVLGGVAGILSLISSVSVFGQFLFGSFFFAPITTVYVFLNLLEMKKAVE